jgi:hypothetical protein
MRKFLLPALALATMALLPGLAFATHFEGFTVGGDCGGWSAQTQVVWRTDVYSADLDFTIDLLDENQNVLEHVSWTGMISRNPGDPANMTYNFSGPWTGTYDDGQYGLVGMMHLVAPWNGGVDDETINYTGQFACIVPNETATWGTIKTLYR